ncbi:MAG: hypothetical protein GX256_03340 [Fretibacterium sp.]|nr:hypothetical protein [Fretibacterium sp.]
MEIRVSLDGVERVVTSEEFLASCGCAGVGLKVNHWGRVILCGQSIPVAQARGLLRASRELEAAVLMKLAEKDRALSELMAERAAILWANGLPDSPFDAALALVAPECPGDEVREEIR